MAASLERAALAQAASPSNLKHDTAGTNEWVVEDEEDSENNEADDIPVDSSAPIPLRALPEAFRILAEQNRKLQEENELLKSKSKSNQ